MKIETYIKHLNATLGEEYIKANIPDATYDFHNEIYYNKKANIDITVKALPGQIQLGVVQYPIQLMIECNEKFKDELIEVLDEFAIEYNEKSVTLDSEDYREYYSTSTVVGPFQNGGTVRNIAISMEVSVISFNNLSGVKSISIKYGSGNTDVIDINYLDFTFTYEAETNSTGAKSAPENKSVVKSFARSVNFAFVPVSSAGVDDLLTSIINRNKSKTYKLTITFKSSTTTDITYDEYVEIKNGAFAQQLQGFPVLRVSFVKSQLTSIGVGS